MEAGQCAACRQAPAKFTCPCVFPPTPICTRCISEHLETEGMHIPVQYKKVAAAPHGPALEGNEVCDECRGKPAVRFCLCGAPLRKFCEGCDFSHYQKAPLVTHSKHPISAYPAVASGRVPVEVFRQKQLYLNDFQLRLGEELVQFDAFVARVEEEFDELFSRIAAKKDLLLRDLQSQRAKLAASLSEIQQTIAAKRYSESFEIKTKLDDYIATGYATLRICDRKMFTGTLDLQGMYELLDKSVVYTVLPNILQTYIQDIPIIKDNNLRLYSRKTLQMTQMTLSQNTKIDGNTAYCYIDAITVMCIGGGNGHKEAYLVNIRSGRVERTSDMQVNRYYVGSWNYKGECVYAFGGHDGSNYLSSCEKYALANKSWSDLQNPMQRPKRRCSVCEHKAGLYLCGLESAGHSIEHFNPRNQIFTLIRSDSSQYAAILCCLGDELYHIWNDKIEVGRIVNASTGITFTVKATIPSSGNYWLCCPTQWVGGELVSIYHAGGTLSGLFSFSPAKPEFTIVVTLLFPHKWSSRSELMREMYLLLFICFDKMA